MASTAPQTPSAIARTLAQGKLLDVADHSELRRGPRGHAIAVNGVGIFERRPGAKIAGLLTRIENLRDPQQVALLTYAVPCSTLQLRGVDDGCWSRMRQVRLGSSVAPVTTNGNVRKRWRLIFVFGARHGLGATRVTEKAAWSYRSREVRGGQRFVSWR